MSLLLRLPIGAHFLSHMVHSTSVSCFHVQRFRGWQQTSALSSLRNSAHRTPLDEITRLRELVNRANATNSKLKKERIVAEYDDLRPLLSYILSPYCRLHVTSDNLNKYLLQREQEERWQLTEAPRLQTTSEKAKAKTKSAAIHAEQEEQDKASIPSTLLGLFKLLGSREATGLRALSLIRTFLNHHGVIEQHKYALSGANDPHLSTSELFRRGLLRPTALDLFTRCLDRNMKAGFSERILRSAFSGTEEDVSEETSKTGIENETRKNESTTTDDGGFQALDSSGVFQGAFEVALGKTVNRAQLPSVLSSADQTQWLVSRKLDGVRCIFVVEGLMLSSNGQLRLDVSSVQSLSRNGRPFTTLAVLESEMMQLLPSCEAVKTLLASSYNLSDGAGPTLVRFVLDGEVCVLLPSDQASKQARVSLDGEITAAYDAPLSDRANQLEERFVEDFIAVVSLMRRKSFSIPNPAYFPFDLLTFDEFTKWRTQPSRSFNERSKIVDALVSHFEQHPMAVDGRSVIRGLQQVPVRRVSDVEPLLATASQRGWEGLILRKDVPYEGKRSQNVRKFKEWKDDEYTVDGITVSTMRLPISGIYAEREAMASIQITHKGSSVSVGSGFTPDERVMYANHPDKIVGKVVTVEYFEESTTAANPKDASQASHSLRFPRIKIVWSEKRDI